MGLYSERFSTCKVLVLVCISLTFLMIGCASISDDDKSSNTSTDTSAVNSPPIQENQSKPDAVNRNSPEELLLEECEDSDGSINYFVEGFVKLPCPGCSMTDACQGNQLEERFCKNNKEFGTEFYNCENGCSNGACNKAPAELPTPISNSQDIKCSHNFECDDGNIDTYDSCKEPGTLNSQCINSRVDLEEPCNKRNYKMAFILVTDNKNTTPSNLIEFLNKIKSEFSDDFYYATNNLATMDTSYPLTIIKIDDSSNLDLNGWLKIFYKDNPDIFDFITVYINFMGLVPNAFHGRTIFTIGGIGDKEFYDNSENYGSNHILVGITYGPSPHLTTPLQITDLINLMNQGDLTYSRVLLHETGHQWCCRVGRNLGILEGSENHWNNFFEANIYSEGQGLDNSWKEIEPGLFRRKIASGERPKYSELMLYLMGLIGPENVKFNYYLIEPEGEFWIGEDGQYNYVKGKIRKYITIQDILNSEGERSCNNKPTENKKEPEPTEKIPCTSRADCKEKCQAKDPSKSDGLCIENECICT